MFVSVDDPNIATIVSADIDYDGPFLDVPPYWSSTTPSMVCAAGSDLNTVHAAAVEYARQVK